MSSPAPELIPLPPSEGTFYQNSSDALVPEPKSAVRPTPRTTRSTRSTRSSTRRTPFAEIFNTIPETPAPMSNSGSFKLETPYEDDEETPRPRNRRGRGKYHPGMRPTETPRTRESTVDSTISDAPEQSPPQQSLPQQSSPQKFSPQPSSPQRSSASGTESDGDSEEHHESEHSQPSEHDSSDAEEGGFDDMDQTVAVNFMPSLKDFPGSTKSQRTTGHLSPGRTPAKQLLSRSNDFTPNFTTDFVDFQETPQPFSLKGAKSGPSMFANVEKTPFLVAGSPKKGMYNAPMDEEDQSWKDARIAELEAMLSGQMQAQMEPVAVEDFIEFSPEKRLADMPEDIQLTIKKRRRSPVKNILGPSRSPISRTPPRRSPIKSYPGLFEGLDIGIVKPTAEQKRASKRRRQTQEFRDFSAINLEELKSLARVPDTVEEDEEMTEHQPDMKEVAEDIPVKDASVEEKEATVTAEEPNEESITNLEAPDTALVEQLPEKESSSKPEVESEPAAIEAAIQNLEPPAEAEYTPPPVLVRSRVRSSSCPPAPQALAPLFPVDPADSTSATDITFHKRALQARISELEEALENARLELSQAEAIIIRQRTELAISQRARKIAESSLEFRELEIKHGACCKHNPGSKPKEKLGPAAVPLPGSPTGSIASTTAHRPATRMGRERPASRLERPASRLGQPRDYNRPTASTTAATKAPATKKRVREEPVSTNGRRTPAPRPEKRVFSGPGIPGAGIVGAQQSKQSALAKKPEKIGAIGRLAATRGATTGTSSTSTVSARGLARGARR